MAKKKANLNVKRIICLKGKGQIGKTGTIKELIKILHSKSVKTPQWNCEEKEQGLLDPYCHSNVEVWIKSKENGKIIHVGLDTEGDEGNRIRKWIDKLAQNGCSVIFCTCRSKLDPRNAVIEIAEKYKYSLITTAPYTIEFPNSKKESQLLKLHEMKAEHLAAFI